MRNVKIVDFHTHAFPDELAARAIPTIEKEANWKAKLDGTVSSLLRSMDAAGIARAVVCSIATKPSQYLSILRWSKQITSERLITFPSVHPSDPQAIERVEEIYRNGFKGIKLHPYYQCFDLDEERIFPLYEKAQECGLVLVVHTGFDIAFPRTRKADPARILRVVQHFPKLKLVTTHFGAWEDWDEVKKHLLGKPILMEISFSIERMGTKRAREMILAHPPECVLFGTDSPWTDQKDSLTLLRALKLGDEREEHILCTNARKLLGGQE